MNKEEFQTKKNDINSKIRELKSQKIQLEKEYIESNAKYPIGSKVCITTPASVYTSLHDLKGSPFLKQNSMPILWVMISVTCAISNHCLKR